MILLILKLLILNFNADSAFLKISLLLVLWFLVWKANKALQQNKVYKRHYNIIEIHSFRLKKKYHRGVGEGGRVAFYKLKRRNILKKVVIISVLF